MQLHPFGNTGLMVSPLGFGGAPVGYLGEELKDVSRLLNTLLDEGLNLIDTAACYPGSERLIGAAVSHRRAEYVLVTKCGHEVEGAAGGEWSPRLVTNSVDRALRRLRTDCLDVMLLHSCPLSVLQKGDALAALVRARDQGKIRFVGYSGDNEAAAYAAGQPDVAVVQTSVNICDQSNIDSVLPRTREGGQGVLAKRPLANAAWKDVSAQRGIYQNYAKSYMARLQSMGFTLADLGFEGDPARVWPGIALRFTLSQPGVHCAIAGTTSIHNARANIQAAGQGPLADPVVRKIRRAFRTARSRSGEVWPGLT